MSCSTDLSIPLAPSGKLATDVLVAVAGDSLYCRDAKSHYEQQVALPIGHDRIRSGSLVLHLLLDVRWLEDN